jgi:hypothetical protein
VTRLRRTALVAAALAIAVALPACAHSDKQLKKLRDIIHATQHESAQFSYALTTPDVRTSVRGIMEDDFRYKARVAIDGTDTYDEVVNDDVLAVRFLDPTKLDTYLSPARASEISATTDLKGVTVGQALKARRWVLDSTGAPAVTAASGVTVTHGADAVLDALTVLDYIDRASTESVEVKRYDPDSINPVYTSSEDTFPRPQKGSGVDRYDFRKPPLPPVSFTQTGGESSFPKTQHFRRMSVYVKNGRVIAVREAVDLRGKALDDFVKYERALLREAKLPQSIRNEYDKLVKATPTADLGLELLKFLNVGLKAEGLPQIDIRELSYELSDIGGGLAVSVPQDEVIKGSLGALALARQPSTQTATQGGAGASATATSTPSADTATSTP